MTFERFQHPAPLYWEEFEDLCLSLFGAVWKYPSAQKNGRRGDAQHGVDVWGRRPDGEWTAVQCKGKDAGYGHRVTKTELRTEVRKALTFEPALSSWTLATSGPKSAAVEAEARRITEEHRPQGLFEVHVMGWDDLRHLIADHPEVIEKHFPDVAPSRQRTARQVDDIHASLFDPSRAGSRAQPAELLRHGSGPSRDGPGLDAAASARLRSTLGAASSLLLNWPTTTAGQWFTRPELATLTEHVTADAPKPLVVLGPPGAGKSAVLARLGNDLASRGVALLALKADAIPRHVTSAAQLDEFLGVPEPLDACLRRLAADQPVVLLIDQLDALADLMDQHGGRLNALLRLVAQVRGCPHLAVVLSCREFEFRHDARLTTLEAEALRLQPVVWAEVEAVLQGRGLSPEGWHPEFREVLRVPQHLDIFLQYLADMDVSVPITGYHGMLEEVFRRRVLAGPEGGENAAALYAVTRAMGEEEDLWVPSARFDAQAASVDRMEAAGFLRREGSRLGFRHQTLFDFVRARAFVATGESVAAYALARQGTIFVRPTVWSALSYLRTADRPAYEREVQQVWDAEDVRPHLRSLLRDLMGRQPDPSDREARRLMPLLASPSTAARTLRAMIGSRGWFRRLLPRMPDLLADAGETGWAAATLLRVMVNEEAPTVIGLMQRCWKNAGHHRQVTHVLDDLRDWTPEALDLATAVMPSMDSFSVVHLAGRMRQLPSTDMARFILARLEAVLAAAQAQPSFREAMEGFLQGSTNLYGLPEIMMRAPGAFARALWPWVACVAEHLASPPYYSGTYRPDGGGMLTRFGDHDAGAESRFGIAYAQVAAAWAGAEPEAFLEFVGAATGSDLCALHCILAEGYVAVAAHRPRAVLEYLAGDPRRFRLGDVTDSDHVTRRLVSAAADHLDGAGVRQLASAIRALAFERELGRFEPATRRDFIRWDREARLRLLLCIPEATRSGELARFIEEEVRAVGIPAPEQGIRMVHGKAVRMSGAAMCKAKDKDIIRFLRPHPDNSEWGNSFEARHGRSIDASRAFREFAKAAPARALRIIGQLPAGELERPAAEALTAFTEESIVPPGDVASLVASLHGRGFRSASFRHAAAYALSRVARPLHGLDDATCIMLRGWLEDCEAPPSKSARSPDRTDEHARPVLWDGAGIRVLPGGNYPVLLALELGMLLREPAAADAWLENLVEHAARSEDPAVWEALADDLRFLVHADHARASAFLGTLLEDRPALANSVAGARLLAWTHAWLPEGVVQRTALRWMDGAWERGPQAAGELVALRWLMNPGDGWAAGLMADALENARPEGDGAFRLGLAYTAEETWDDPRYRDAATSIVERLSASEETEVAGAVSRVFQRARGKVWDAATERVLRVAATWPAVLAANAHSLPDVLKEALRDGMDPSLVASVALGIVRGAGSQLGDARTSWASSAGDLFEIATALQRTHAVREGIELFEALLEAEVHGVSEAMARFDRSRFA